MGYLVSRIGRAVLVHIVVASVALPVAAQEGAGGGIRLISPPGPGHTGPRITVQIRPGDNFTTPAPGAAVEPTAAAAPSAPRAEAPGEASADWFWSAISPSLPADPGRFWAARDHLAQAGEAADLGAPRLDDMLRLAEAHGRDLLMASIGTEISPALALAVIAVESAGRAEVTSHAGAQGLMQLMPDTAARFGVEDAFDPLQNITGGIAYLDWLMGEFDRDPLLVLAAYNAGEGAVRRAGGVPDYPETRSYVPRVLAAWDLARNLCRTPPLLVSDGCVFQPMAVQ
ncbi:lytic transglycosylase domain-containing protein [Roseibacterium beibuensis]|uniref:Lytic transglycosylase domain-containing protein n=1 Tax=[Roseibacterium] beibuensis TaxID=1193142 RepID=A0ABP9KXL7_9RHOB|nr:lytic transglycosylase domain-containing protein [Roseibacterium beibuensis]MCS6622283.1 lytic transglycosylase domain-containing protein [Roseibacterium beibuensis]